MKGLSVCALNLPHWLLQDGVPVDQLSDECPHVGNFYSHSGAVLDNSAVPESVSCGGRRFQLHLKCRGGQGDLAHGHSLRRHGPDNGLRISMCAHPVGFMADTKKWKQTQNTSSWHAACWRALGTQHLILRWKPRLICKLRQIVPSGQIRETVSEVSLPTLKNVLVSSCCLISIASPHNTVDNKQSSTRFPLEMEEGDRQEGCNSLK